MYGVKDLDLDVVSCEDSRSGSLGGRETWCVATLCRFRCTGLSRTSRDGDHKV